MADAESSEVLVPAEPEAVPTAGPSRESTVDIVWFYEVVIVIFTEKW